MPRSPPTRGHLQPESVSSMSVFSAGDRAPGPSNMDPGRQRSPWGRSRALKTSDLRMSGICAPEDLARRW
eukprot:9264528-Pyramimonas_sp.AAC.1